MVDRKPTREERQEARMRQRMDMVEGRLEEQRKRVDERFKKATDRLQEHVTRANPYDIWRRPAGGNRRQPKLSRDDMVAAAVRLADAEGLDALSMRRLAQELGTGTMSLYYYVQTKDDLLSLVVNEVMGEIAIPPGEPIPEHWRDAIKLIAVRTRDALDNHRWILDIKSDPSMGPSSIRHFEQSLQATKSMNVDHLKRFDYISMIDEYVFGFCWQNRSNDIDNMHVGDEDREYFEEFITAEEFPEITALVNEYGMEGFMQEIATAMTNNERFERNLNLILDGIQAEIETER
jgi:AcrR family transcriptional regulator